MFKYSYFVLGILYFCTGLIFMFLKTFCTFSVSSNKRIIANWTPSEVLSAPFPFRVAGPASGLTESLSREKILLWGKALGEWWVVGNERPLFGGSALLWHRLIISDFIFMGVGRTTN
ncbi:Hypothetical predicted protein [Podarcis lilfordi]|uniref:Uncharacterized protein n=1 Tax=Podarcis lilfordi TaxID=74358 RepID=A0AA35LDL8_9SAUR|nr:Hypothetical predicted protein [Podarcis lilfordi]